ncbi:uncharacterized protein [Diabrotica undecimpunctata]|uniref:uncharacterized protein n=1 Tax=Diabrotica undecimpunctata TaxID=50387 RepID=UPI003B63F309
MIVEGTRFLHKIIHKGTWKSPNNKTINQIDHILIDARHPSDLMDVRSYRGPNIDSDHFLVMAKIRERMSNLKKDKHNMKQDRINVDNLKDNVEELWIKCRNIITENASEILGITKPIRKNEWFDLKCQKTTDNKNKAYLKTN